MTTATIVYQPEATPEYPYNVQIRNGGAYAGDGRFFRTLNDAQEYAYRRVGRDSTHYYNALTGIYS